MRRFASILAVVCVLGVVCPSYATVINFDLFDGTGEGGTPTFYTGTAAAPDAGTYWTPYRISWGDSTYYPCLESDGITASPVVVTIAGGGYAGYWYYDGTGIAPEMMDSYAYSKNGTGWTFSIEHLTPGGLYDLYWYQQNGIAANSTGSFTIGATTLTSTNSGQIDAFIENDNYVHFRGVAADGVGTITGTISSSAQFGGLQIMSIPEPSAFVLLGVGVVGLLAYAWRKRK
jgi:hypothetical protein